MTSTASKSLFLILIVPFAGILPIATARAQSREPEYKILKFDVKLRLPQLQPKEKRCSYFLWTKFGTEDQRLGFQFAMDSGGTDGDDPKINGHVSIVIDRKRSAPTAQRNGTDKSGYPIWILRMSQTTYDQEQTCLEGVPIEDVPLKK
jgi:hypothetical protein